MKFCASFNILHSFLDDLQRINVDGYLPTTDDVIRVRKSTVGVIRKFLDNYQIYTFIQYNKFIFRIRVYCERLQF